MHNKLDFKRYLKIKIVFLTPAVAARGHFSVLIEVVVAGADLEGGMGGAATTLTMEIVHNNKIM